MEKRQTRERKRQPEIWSQLKKGELKDCSKCRFGCKKEECNLPFINRIEIAEEKKGYCIYFAKPQVRTKEGK